MTKPRESKIESYFVEQVEKAGGLTRKCRWLCRRGAPDRFVALSGSWGFVELKRTGLPPDPHQAREHAKLGAQGVRVILIDSFEAVDKFVEQYR